MHSSNRSRSHAAFMTLLTQSTPAKSILTKSLLTAVVLSLATGCRNTTNSPGAPLGTSSPLSPFQGSATLSPLQPASGIGNFGGSTRVPPPPTGSYSSQNSYVAPTTFGTPQASTFAPTGLAPSGTTLGSSGMTRGVTELNPSVPVPMGGTGAGVRQTGWVGEGGTGTNGFGGMAPPTQGPPAVAPAPGPRAGGMQVIDLTGGAFPQGYVPPQNRPGAVSIPQSVPYPRSAPPTIPQAPANQNQFGQPTGSTFVNSSSTVPSATVPSATPSTTSFGATPTIQTASRPNNVVLPSTEPFPTAVNSSSEDLQWRRPSPRF